MSKLFDTLRFIRLNVKLVHYFFATFFQCPKTWLNLEDLA